MLSTAIIAYLAVFASVAWRNRYHGLWWLAFALPTYGVRFNIGPIPTTLLEVSIGILAVVVILKERGVLLEKIGAIAKSNLLQKVLLITIALFLISATISVFTSPSLIKSLGIWRAYFVEPTILFIIALIVLKSEKQVRGIVWAMAATMIVISVVAIIQRFTGWNIPATWLAERRVTGIYSYPNAVGLYLAPLIPLVAGLAAYYAQQKKKLFAVGFAAVGIISLVAIVFAKTEAAIVALAAALFLFGIFWNKGTRFAALLAAIALGLTLYVSPPALHLAQQKLLLKDYSGQVRQWTWTETRKMLADHWLNGAGLAGYQEVFAPYHKKKIEIFLYPHNIVMNFWSEMGLYGMISFFAMILAWLSLVVAAMVRSWKYQAAESTTIIKALSLGLLCSIATILIHGLVDVPFFKNDLAAQFFLLIAISIAVYNQGRCLTPSKKTND